MTVKPPPIQIDSWQAAERNAAAWMRYWGHRDAKVTAGGPDGGVDVRSAGALAQVKFEAAQVGAPAMQRLVGARGRSHHMDLYFFSGAGYARPAVEYADMMDIALFKYALDGSMRAVNGAARKVVQQVPASPPPTPLPPLVEPVELAFWTDLAQMRTRARRVANAGWLRRNGWLLFGLMWAYICVGTLLEAAGVTDPPDDAERVGFGPVPIAAAMSVGSIMLWRFLAKRRRRLASTLPTLPSPGPLSEAAVAVLKNLPGTPIAARVQAVRPLLGASSSERR